MLIFGDSFAEGQVNFDERFDSRITQRSKVIHAIAIGAGGYGTDQELLLAEQYLGELRAGDLYVLLTCGNDFQDILRRSSFGRKKPWFTLDGQELHLHLPEFGLLDDLRDRSFIVGYYLQWADHMKYSLSPEELQYSQDLFRAMVKKYLVPLRGKGIRLIIAHHVDWLVGGDLSALFASLEDQGVEILALDPLIPRKFGYREADDLHWSTAGNLAVAKALLKKLDATDNH